MSIRSLITPQNKPLPLYCSSLNQTQLKIPLSSVAFTATPPTPITNRPVSGFLFSGATGATPSAIFYFSFLGGILGSATVAIRSADLITTYFLGTLLTDNSTSVTLTAVDPLPVSEVPLIVVINSDATCNSTFLPLSLTLNY